MTALEIFGLALALVGFWIAYAFIARPLVRDFRNRRVAFAKLPAFAAQLGLKHRPAESTGLLGRYSGTYEGYQIEITPDEQFTRLEVTLDHPLPDLSVTATFNLAQRAAKRLIALLGAPLNADNNFEFGVAILDRTLDRRVAEDAAREKLTSGPVLKALEAYVLRWQSELYSLSISPHSISCNPVLGMSKKMCSITPTQIQALLPGLIALARTLDGAEGSPAGSKGE